MKITFFPKTKLGKWSAWLVIIGFLIIIFLNIIVGIIHSNDKCDENGICYSSSDGIFRIFNIVLSLLAMASVVIAGITSIISVFKYKDYSIILFITSLLGILGIIFVLGEFLVPH